MTGEVQSLGSAGGHRASEGVAKAMLATVWKPCADRAAATAGGALHDERRVCKTRGSSHADTMVPGSGAQTKELKLPGTTCIQ